MILLVYFIGESHFVNAKWGILTEHKEVLEYLSVALYSLRGLNGTFWEGWRERRQQEGWCDDKTGFAGGRAGESIKHQNAKLKLQTLRESDYEEGIKTTKFKPDLRGSTMLTNMQATWVCKLTGSAVEYSSAFRGDDLNTHLHVSWHEFITFLRPERGVAMIKNKECAHDAVESSGTRCVPLVFTCGDQWSRRLLKVPAFLQQPLPTLLPLTRFL